MLSFPMRGMWTLRGLCLAIGADLVILWGKRKHRGQAQEYFLVMWRHVQL